MVQPCQRKKTELKMLKLGSTNLWVSKFIFGTAKIHHVYSPKSRSRILSEAVANGFTHFDTSPLYGFGIAEKDLGRLIKDNPEITVTTKFGLYPPGKSGKSYLEIYSRKAIGRKFASLSCAQSDFDLDLAKKSLYRSLRRLNKESIELFMLHEPPEDLLQKSDILDFLLQSKQRGLIRNFGVSGNIQNLNQFFSPTMDFLEVVQIQETDFAKLVQKLDVTTSICAVRYGVASSKEGKEIGYLQKLRNAVVQYPKNPIIVSTNKVDRLKQYEDLLGSIL